MDNNEKLIHDLKMHIGREFDEHGKVDASSIVLLATLQKLQKKEDKEYQSQ